MSPFVIRSADEARALVGKVLGESGPLIVDAARLRLYAESTQGSPKATPEPKALEGPLDHSFLPLTLIPAFAAQIFTIAFGTARLNYGPKPSASGHRSGKASNCGLRPSSLR